MGMKSRAGLPAASGGTPAFITRPKIVGAPVDYLWKGAGWHIGPVETVNKRFKDVGSKTTCGMLTQAAGIISWGAWRLKGQTDVSTLMHMIEASFAFQVHPDYVDSNAAPTYQPVEQPPAESAAMELQEFLWQALNADKYWHDYYQPFESAFHTSYVVRHILPKPAQRAFRAWLNDMLQRIGQIAPKPDEPPAEDEDAMTPQELAKYYARHWGQPLPPHSLELERPYDPAERVHSVDQFLRGLSWQDNPFLRSPEQMAQRGFEGLAYTYELSPPRPTAGEISRIAAIRGWEHTQAGHFERAVPCLREAVALQPGFSEAHTNLAWSLLRIGRYEDATTHCERAIELSPGQGLNYWNLAAARAELGDDVGFYESITRALELGCEVWNDLSEVPLRLHTTSKFRALLQRFKKAAKDR